MKAWKRVEVLTLLDEVRWALNDCKEVPRTQAVRALDLLDAVGRALAEKSERPEA